MQKIIGRRSSEDAVGQVYGFMIGGIVFLAAIGAIFAYAQSIGRDVDRAAPAHAAQDVDAASLLDLILGDAGAGWASPDSLLRFGLSNGTSGMVDGAHLRLLDPATLEGQANGRVEYSEALRALGLDGMADFQLQAQALDYDGVLQQHDFSHTKALYIGDFTTLTGITLGIGQGTIANANAQLNLSMGAHTGLERTVIDSIGVDFDNQMHLIVGSPHINVQVTTVPPVSLPLLSVLGLTVWDGDVLYDNKQFIDAVLPGKLENGGYDLLIIGSGIDHSTLTANSVKGSINAFVRAGGTLMVFGSPGANYNWMQPVMSISATGVSGPVTAPDADHPILRTPHDLAWPSCPTNNLAWTVAVPSSFENVLVQGGQPVLAVSNDGAIGAGHVFLSSIQPRAVANSLGQSEAADFMFNLLLYDRDTSSDPSTRFGPEPPPGVPVSSAARTVVLEDGGQQVPMRFEILVWGT